MTPTETATTLGASNEASNAPMSMGNAIGNVHVTDGKFDLTY